jgi:hypothetical protein
MENYFQKTILLNPFNSDSYFLYLEYLKPKWTGSEKDLMDFAAKYSERFPYLMVNAADENMVGVKGLLSKKMLGPESREAYQKSPDVALLEKYSRLYLLQWPYDTGTWERYFMFAERAGHLDEASQWVSGLGGRDPYMAALPVVLKMARYNAHYWNLDTNQEKSVYWQGPEGLKEMTGFYLEMAKLDPENWFWLNRALCLQAHTGQVQGALESFKRVGEAHWDPVVCDKSDWETAKSWVTATPTALPGPSLLHTR